MSIFGACMLFVGFIFVYVVIAEVFTVLFRFTGLTAERARFQVISLLTNSGYTTKESELITSVPRRRQLAQATMLFGYAFTVTIVSTIVNIFLAFKLSELTKMVWEVWLPVMLLLALLILMRNKHTRRWFDSQIEKTAHRLMFKNEVNRVLLLEYFGEMAIAELTLTMVPAAYRDKELAGTDLRELGILILVIQRKGKRMENVTGETRFQTGDLLLAFGPLENMRAAFCPPIPERPEEKKQSRRGS